MFDVTLLAGPLVGAVIGYGTNYLAVRMLFHPRKPIRIGGHTLPFTPGIIPKGKTRLAGAIASAVGNQLLTPEALEEVLLTQEMKERVCQSVQNFVENQRNNSTRLGQISERIGEGVASQLIKTTAEAVSGSFLAMVINEKTLSGLRPLVADKVNEITLGETASMVLDADVDIGAMAENVYTNLVQKHLADLLRVLDLEGMIRRQIEAMDEAELEQLLLGLMKKELDAVVRLGAVIGLVLGGINILI